MDVPSFPTLSLTLAGNFGNAEAARRDDSSSDNSDPAGSMSAEDLCADIDDEDDDKSQGNRKKRKNIHSSEQIGEMEKVFKESPYLNENQRQQLSEKLGLQSKQIQFWFQNRRNRNKASLKRQEMEKLRKENQTMKKMIDKSSCPKCSSSALNDQQQQLATEIVQLKAEVERYNIRFRLQVLEIDRTNLRFPGREVERLQTALEKYCPARASTSRSNEEGNLEKSNRIFGAEQARVMEMAKRAIEEVVKMADSGEPLWVRSFDAGRELLNYDEYVKEFGAGDEGPVREIEASRESGVVFFDLQRLVQSFMDVVQWKEMFPSIISKASTMEVVCNGDGTTWNGAFQLMFAELQMLTPSIPPREVHFIRSCKQIGPQKWVIADVSHKFGDGIDSSFSSYCTKRPSGCIIHYTSNGRCKVTWIEHWKCPKIGLHTIYRTVVDSGLIFGARHWMATLQIHCERQVFFMATNVTMKDSTGITTTGGRKSVLKLAQRMTSSIYQAIGASSSHTWAKVQSKIGENIRVASRKNVNDPQEPLGLILCAVASVWLPISPKVLFEFLIDESRRTKWDVMLSSPVETVATFATGQNRGNAVTIQATKSDETNMWIIQDSLTNEYESTVVYAQVDITSMKSVMEGCELSSIAALPMGFSILPDGHSPRPSVISSNTEENGTEGGSLLTIATQINVSSSPTAKSSSRSVEYVTNYLSHTLQNIKANLQCEDD